MTTILVALIVFAHLLDPQPLCHNYHFSLTNAPEESPAYIDAYAGGYYTINLAYVETHPTYGRVAHYIGPLVDKPTHVWVSVPDGWSGYFKQLDCDDPTAIALSSFAAGSSLQLWQLALLLLILGIILLALGWALCRYRRSGNIVETDDDWWPL